MPVPYKLHKIINGRYTMKPPPRNRKSPRKKDYDYTLSGAYFVTICTYERQLIFGDIVDSEMQHTSLGQIAHNCWHTSPDHFPDVEIDCFVVMPNHVHVIVINHDQDTNDEKYPNLNDNVGNRYACSLQDNKSNTPEPTRGIFKNGRFIPPGVKSGSLGAMVGSYESTVTKIANRTLSDPPSKLWQRFYHDHIIRNEREFNMIRQYVHANPARWDADRFNE